MADTTFVSKVTTVTTAWAQDVNDTVYKALGAAKTAADAVTALGLSELSNTSDAGGTADALTGSYSPGITALINGMLLYVRADAANATTTPTFTPANGVIAAKAIVKGANRALLAGDIAGAGHWLELQYDSILDKWALLNPATSAFLQAAAQGARKNLVASATGISAAVAVSYDELVLGDGAGLYVTERGVSGTITTTNTGAGGLDTGTLAVSTWYSLWRIGKLDGTRNWLFSLSDTTPTMPSGYTLKARFGWFRTEGSGNKFPLPFKQKNEKVQYAPAAGTNLTSLPSLGSGVQGSISTPIWATFPIANYVPSTAGLISAVLGIGAAGGTCAAAPNNNYGASTSVGNQPPFLLNTSSAAACFGSFIPEDTNVYYYSNAASTALQVLGWEDRL